MLSTSNTLQHYEGFTTCIASVLFIGATRRATVAQSVYYAEQCLKLRSELGLYSGISNRTRYCIKKAWVADGLPGELDETLLIALLQHSQHKQRVKIAKFKDRDRGLLGKRL
jgi:hypothetical protein